MSADDRSGVVDSSKVYTVKAIARIIGRTDRWIWEKLIYEGLPCFYRGDMCMVSGHVFNLWIQELSETNAKETKEQQPRKARGSDAGTKSK